MKVLITSGIFPPDIGGPATYAINLCRELRRLGCEVRIITYGNGITAEGVLAVKRNQNILSRYIKFFLLAWRLSPWADIVYTLDLMSAGLPAAMAAKIRKKKVIFRTGGDFLWEKAMQKGWTDRPLLQYYERLQKTRNLAEAIYRRLCTWVLNRMDLVVFSTPLQADIYKKVYNLSPLKIKLIPNASTSRFVQEASDEFRDYLVFAGRLIKLKNLERLIGAVAELGDKGIKLVIFGQGPEKDNLQRLIKELNAEAYILLKNSIEHEKLINIIVGSKFVVLPSLTEISPNLALECLSMSKPIVLTNQTGLRKELIGELITFDPLSLEDLKKSIEYLLDPAHLSEYAAKMKQLKIEEWGWDKIAAEHINIFKNLLDGKNFIDQSAV